MKARYTCTLNHAKKLVIMIWIASFILAMPIIKGQVNCVMMKDDVSGGLFAAVLGGVQQECVLSSHRFLSLYINAVINQL